MYIESLHYAFYLFILYLQQNRKSTVSYIFMQKRKYPEEMFAKCIAYSNKNNTESFTFVNIQLVLFLHGRYWRIFAKGGV